MVENGSMADIAGGQMQGSVQGHWYSRWDAGISSEGDASTTEIKQTWGAVAHWYRWVRCSRVGAVAHGCQDVRASRVGCSGPGCHGTADQAGVKW